MTIDDIIAGVLGDEGGYSNNAADSGGETMWGITAAVARQQGYAGAMRDMPKAEAIDIYRRLYVIRPGFDQIAALSMPIAAELINTGVNMGPAVATHFLQRALNGLNNQGRDWPDMTIDGVCGPSTVNALKTFLAKRGGQGEARLVALLNAQQGVRYLELCEGRQADETFLYGWLKRIAA